MAIDLFSLVMRLQTVGFDKARTDLSGLDQQGARTAAALGGLSSNFNRAEVAANAKAAATGALAARMGSLGGVMTALGPIGIAVGGTLALTAGIMRTTAPEADALRISMLRLDGASRLTGTSLGFLEGVSRRAQSAFRLSAIQSNELTAEIAKLTGKAGDLSQTSAVLAAFLNIGAAQGMTAEQTLVAVHQAILGIDEGTDKLFQKNPSVIYKEFADSIGTTVGKLTDQQKAQALVAAALEASTRVGNAYERFLDTAVGKQAQLATATERFQAALGRVFEPLRGWLADVGARFFNWLGDIIERMSRLSDGMEGMGRMGNVFAVPRFLDRFIRAALGQGDDPFAEVEGGSSTTGVRPAPRPAPTKAEIDAAARARKAHVDRMLDSLNASPADRLEFQGFPSTIATRDDRIDISGNLFARQPRNTETAWDHFEAQQRRHAQAVTRSFAMLGTNMGMAVADGFSAAMSAAMQGKNPFTAFGKAVLAGLGSIFTQMGAELIAYGVIMLNLLPFLSNPFTSGPAAIAAGAALVAIGTVLGGIATGSGSKGGGKSGGPVDTVTKITLTADGLGGMAAPKGKEPVTVLGIETPMGQRVLSTATKNRHRRGMS